MLLASTSIHRLARLHRKRCLREFEPPGGRTREQNQHVLLSVAGPPGFPNCRTRNRKRNGKEGVLGICCPFATVPPARIVVVPLNRRCAATDRPPRTGEPRQRPGSSGTGTPRRNAIPEQTGRATASGGSRGILPTAGDPGPARSRRTGVCSPARPSYNRDAFGPGSTWLR